jgi:hypothetical protein
MRPGGRDPRAGEPLPEACSRSAPNLVSGAAVRWPYATHWGEGSQPAALRSSRAEAARGVASWRASKTRLGTSGPPDPARPEGPAPTPHARRACRSGRL